MCLGELVVCEFESAANRDKRNTNTKPSAAPVRKATPPTSSSHFYEIPEPLFTGSAPEDAVDPLSCGLSTTIVILEILLCLGKVAVPFFDSPNHGSGTLLPTRDAAVLQ